MDFTSILLVLIFAILVAIFLFPERVDSLRASFWRGAERIGFLTKIANKQKNKYTIQGVVNSFSNELNKDIPSFTPPKIELEYVAEKQDRKAFIHEGKAVIRIRKQDPHNVNTVAACMLYISNILLRKTIRYVSKSQRRSIELYTGYKLLGSETKDVYNEFVNNWLYPGIEESDDKIAAYFEDFLKLDKSELFIPVLLQEIVHLGEKVFGKKRTGAIISEVDEMVQFLKTYALRRTGTPIEPYLDGANCRFAIMIVGLPENILDENHLVYTRHILNALLPKNVETIYMVGDPLNRVFIDRIVKTVENEYSKIFSKEYDVTLFKRDGSEFSAKRYLVIVRKDVRTAYIP